MEQEEQVEEDVFEVIAEAVSEDNNEKMSKSEGNAVNESCLTQEQQRRVPFALSLFLSSVFFLIWIYLWTGAVYSYGAAWYSLLIASLFIFLGRNTVYLHSNLYIDKEYSFLFFIVVILTTLLTIAGGIAGSIHGVINGEDDILRPIMIVIIVIVLFFVIYLLRAPTSPLSGKITRLSVDETTNRRPSCCCNCCNYFLMFLITFASIFIFVTITRENRYSSNSESLLVQVENDEFMDFRCKGQGEPLVLLFHGYGGQALDFQHIIDNVQNQTTVCSFSRLGYGLSRTFASRERTSENFAIELDLALQNLNIDADKFNNVIVAGHSMGGFNMRAYDKVFPNRIAAMFMIDPVDPNLTDDCVTGGININDPISELFVRISDSGLPLILQALGVINLFGQVEALPKRVQKEYQANVLRADFHQTRSEEGKNWGETCEFVKDHKATYPVTVFIPEFGIYADDLSQADIIQTFSDNPESKTVAQTGKDADHSGALFNIIFAQTIIDEIIIKVQEIQIQSLDL